MKMAALWDVFPCSLTEINVSEVLTASIIRTLTNIPTEAYETVAGRTELAGRSFPTRFELI